MAKSDIEIAREAEMQPITEVGSKLNIPPEHLLHYGPHKAKISFDYINSLKNKTDGKLILITAITPTRPSPLADLPAQLASECSPDQLHLVYHQEILSAHLEFIF